MRPEDLLNALADIGDDLIDETDVQRKKSGVAFRDKPSRASICAEKTEESGKISDIRNTRPGWRRWTAMAAGIALLLVAGGLVFRFVTVRTGGRGEMSSAAAEATADSGAKEFAMEEDTAMGNGEADEPATAPEEAAESAEAVAGEAEEGNASESREIRVKTNAGDIVFKLNDSNAARSLQEQLPLTVDTELYGDNEVVFHPPVELDITDGIEGGGEAGMLGYFVPWNNVILYYGDFDAYPGLYILGTAVEGAEFIGEIRGEITVE